MKKFASSVYSIFRKKLRSEVDHRDPSLEPLQSPSGPYEKLSQIMPQFEAAFFAQIKESGVLEDVPYVKLCNGDILFGYSDPAASYYKGVFDTHASLFESIGLKRQCFGAAFDAMISYHYENCDSWTIRKAHFVPRRGVVLDVGVRGSHFSVKASRLVVEEGKVVAIDATDFAERFTELHVRHNRLSNVRFVRAIVGDQDGKETDFFYGSSGETFSGIFGQTVDGNGKPIVYGNAHTGRFRGTMRTLDGITEDLGLNACDLVIMQINGGESLAIQGMDRVLQSFRPVLFITAFQKEPEGCDPVQAIKKLCSRYGYRVFSQQKASIILVPD